MLYLHCGWPKTGTTSLQAALVKHRDRLASTGLVYPGQWQGCWGETDYSHHGLVELLKDRLTVDRAIEGLERVQAADPDSDILLSCENFTLLLDLLDDDEPPLTFMYAIREAMPVTCVWVLRRFDEFRRSLYLQFVSIGHFAVGPREFMDDRRGQRLFTRIQTLESYVDDTVYIRYDPSEHHPRELLPALGIPAEARNTIERELSVGPELNRSLSHKQAVSLLNFEALTARAGMELDKRALWDGLRSGSLLFAEDGPCRLVDNRARRGLHGDALEAARQCGFEPYVRFFADDMIADSSDPVHMGPEELSDEDLDLLVRTCSISPARAVG
jgi:hypothetical protein